LPVILFAIKQCFLSRK